MRKMGNFSGLAFLFLVIACSSVASKPTHQWQLTAISDVKDVAGKWDGILVRNPRTRDDDFVTLAISDASTFEFVSYRQIGAFAGKGNLVLSDGKLSARSDKGSQMNLQLYRDPTTGERMLKVDGKDGEGYTYAADLSPAGSAASAK